MKHLATSSTSWLVGGLLLLVTFGPYSASPRAQVPCSVAEANAAVSTVRSDNGEIYALTGLAWSNLNQNLAYEPHTIMRIVTNRGRIARDIHWQVGRMLVRPLRAGRSALHCVSGSGFPDFVGGDLYFGPTRDDKMTARTFVSSQEPLGMNRLVGASVSADTISLAGDAQESLSREPYAVTTRFVVPSDSGEASGIDIVFENSVTLQRSISGGLEYVLSYEMSSAAASTELAAHWLPPPVGQLLMGEYMPGASRQATITTTSVPILSLRTITVSREATVNEAAVGAWFDVAALLP